MCRDSTFFIRRFSDKYIYIYIIIWAIQIVIKYYRKSLYSFCLFVNDTNRSITQNGYPEDPVKRVP